jgi:fatty acid synthase
VALLLRNLGDETSIQDTILRLSSNNDHKNYQSAALLVPGIEGVAGNAWHMLASQLSLPTFILQLTETMNLKTIDEIASAVLEVSFTNLFWEGKKVTFLFFPGRKRSLQGH